MTLPLFPLDTVLFPGCNLDLQLFEPRYLDMLSACLRRGEGFGVVTLLDGAEVGRAPRSYSEFGCEALIRDWRRQDNGLLGIRVEGGRRLRVDGARVQPDQLTITWEGAGTLQSTAALAGNAAQWTDETTTGNTFTTTATGTARFYRVVR